MADECGDTGDLLKSNSRHLLSPRIRNSESNVSLRGPWVPAPAKTTQSSSFIEDEKHIQSKGPAQTQGHTQSTRSFFTPKKKYRRRARRSSCGRGGDDVNLSGYTLKTKDSLVDVSACLIERREEVLKLWEKNLPGTDAELIEDLERANTLALEAARDVDQLRRSIQDLKQKPVVSPQAAQELDELRSQIVSKLELFEETHSRIQLRLHRTKESASQTNHHHPPPKSSKSRSRSLSMSRSPRAARSRSTGTSTTADHKNLSSLIVLKQKGKEFSEGETDQELDLLEPDYGLNSGGVGSRGRSPRKKLESAEDLSKLYHLYTQHKFKLSPLPEVSEDKSKSSMDLKGRAAGISVGPLPFEYDDAGLESYIRPGRHHDTCIYRDKIHGLHEKLLDQETKTEQLTRDMQRIESQSCFDLRMLKSKVRERLDELEHVPELLQLTERRLNESLQGKHVLETNLQLRTQELISLKKEMEKLERELEDVRRKGETHEHKIEALKGKTNELTAVNHSLRVELKTAKDQVQRLRIKCAENVPGEIGQLGRKKDNVLLEDRIAELERELVKEKKKSSILKQAKDNLAVEMTRREEDVLESLEESRRRNRSLQNQLHFIKSSYHTIFPADLLQPPPSALDDRRL